MSICRRKTIFLSWIESLVFYVYLHLFISNEPNNSRIFLEFTMVGEKIEIWSLLMPWKLGVSPSFLIVPPSFRDLPPFWMKFFKSISNISNFSIPPLQRGMTICNFDTSTIQSSPLPLSPYKNQKHLIISKIRSAILVDDQLSNFLFLFYIYFNLIAPA